MTTLLWLGFAAGIGALGFPLAFCAVIALWSARASAPRPIAGPSLPPFTRIASMPAAPLSITFSDEAREWLHAALEETLRKERDTLEQRLTESFEERVCAAVEREVARQVEALRAIADQTARHASSQGLQGTGGSGSQIARDDPNVEFLERIQERLKRLGNKGSEVMDLPHDFNKFREENSGKLFKVRDAGHLELLPDKVARGDQHFFAVPDPQSGYFGLFLGPEICNHAEGIRAAPSEFKARCGAWFDIAITGQGLALVQPALLYPSDDGDFALALKGRIHV